MVGRTEFSDVVGQASETCTRDKNTDVAPICVRVSPEQNRALRGGTNRSSSGTFTKCLIKASIMGT